MTGPVTIDGGDCRCLPLLIELRRLTLQVPADPVIHLIATDPAAPLDLPAWCDLTGHTYLGQLPATEPATCALRVTADASRPPRTASARPALTGGTTVRP